MSDPSSENIFATAGQPSKEFIQVVRSTQIILAALAGGVLTITVVMLVVSGFNTEGAPEILSMAGAGFAGMAFLAHAIIPGVILKAQLQQLDKEQFASQSEEGQRLTVLSRMRVPHIIAGAMLEGAAFFNAIVFLMENWIGSIAIAAFFGVIILLRIPSVYGSYNKATDYARQITQT